MTLLLMVFSEPAAVSRCTLQYQWVDHPGRSGFRTPEIPHDRAQPTHGIMLGHLFLWRNRSTPLGSNESEMSTMADPECVGLNSISHLVADHCSRSTPTVVLASATALHLVLGSLCLPVVDLSAGKVDLMTAKVRPGGRRSHGGIADCGPCRWWPSSSLGGSSEHVDTRHLKLLENEQEVVLHPRVGR